MINVIAGINGQGKTVRLAQLAREALEDPKEDREIWSNFWLNDSRVHFSINLLELFAGENRIVFLDEGQMFLNSRNWENLPSEIQFLLQEQRKGGLDVWITVQNFKRLDVVVRELVGAYYESVKLLGTSQKGKIFPKHPWGIYSLTQYAVEDFDLKHPKIVGGIFGGIRFFVLRKRNYTFYDSLKRVGRPPESFKDNVIQVPMYVCPECGARKLLK